MARAMKRALLCVAALVVALGWCAAADGAASPLAAAAPSPAPSPSPTPSPSPSSTSIAATSNATTEAILLKKLLESYEPRVRPVKSSSERMVVEARLRVVSLDSADASAGAVTMTVFFEMNWRDPFLTWNETEYEGIKEINIAHDEIWIPKLTLLNSASSFEDSLEKPNVLVRSNGDTLWARPGSISYGCDFEMWNFPYDVQNCGAIFGSTVENDKQLTLRVSNRGDAVILVSDVSSSWTITNAQGIDTNRTIALNGHPDIVFMDVRFSFSMTRSPGYFVSTVILPSMLVTCVAMFTFIIPDEPGSERVGLGITSVLSIVALILVQADGQQGSGNSRMAVFQFGCLIFTLLSLATTAVVLHFSRRGGTLQMKTKTAKFFGLKKASEVAKRPFNVFDLAGHHDDLEEAIRQEEENELGAQKMHNRNPELSASRPSITKDSGSAEMLLRAASMGSGAFGSSSPEETTNPIYRDVPYLEVSHLIDRIARVFYPGCFGIFCAWYFVA